MHIGRTWFSSASYCGAAKPPADVECSLCLCEHGCIDHHVANPPCAIAMGQHSLCALDVRKRRTQTLPQGRDLAWVDAESAREANLPERPASRLETVGPCQLEADAVQRRGFAVQG
jgi:hypothetical protein